MMVVTAVNGCSYCSWFHARTSLGMGMDKKEVVALLNLQFDSDATDYEMVGLLYAQHYAETEKKPDNDMRAKLSAFYGETTATHLCYLLRVISFGNLQGNTFDAFLSRLKGKPAEKSNVLFEGLFFIVHAPFFLPLIRAASAYK